MDMVSLTQLKRLFMIRTYGNCNKDSCLKLIIGQPLAFVHDGRYDVYAINTFSPYYKGVLNELADS